MGTLHSRPRLLLTFSLFTNSDDDVKAPQSHTLCFNYPISLVRHSLSFTRTNRIDSRYLKGLQRDEHA